MTRRRRRWRERSERRRMGLKEIERKDINVSACVCVSSHSAIINRILNLMIY